MEEVHTRTGEYHEFDLSALVLHNNVPSPPLVSPSSSSTPATEPGKGKGISKRRGKKRSSRACSICRLRKVRCDIVAHGAPCSNCRHDEVDCILPLSRRQRSALDRADNKIHEFKDSSETEKMRSLDTEAEQESSYTRHIIEQAFTPSNLAPHGMRISEHPLSEILPVVSSPKPREIQPTSFRTRPWVQIQSPLASAPVPATQPMNALNQRIPRLPSVFTPFHKSLDSTDMTYLHTRDALTLPSEILQVALLKSYVNHVHWNMPILDLEEFLCVVKYGCRESSVGKSAKSPHHITFLLFQAVLFAGAEHVGMKFLREAGWRNREDARKALFGRVKILYDFDTTTDRLSIIQSLLLMSLYTPSISTAETMDYTPSCTKDASHYLNLAISLCYSLGLHRERTLPITGCSNSSFLGRRIFWTAFIRDRLLTTKSEQCLRRPVRIKRLDCQISMPSLADFDIPPESDDNDSETTIHERVSANAYIEKAILCWNMSDVSLDLQHHWPQNLIETMYERPSIWQSDNSYHQQKLSTPTARFCSPFARSPTALKSDSYPSPEIDRSFDHPAPSSTTSSESPLLTPSFFEERYTTLSFGENSSGSKFGSGTSGGNVRVVAGVDGEHDDYLEFLEPGVCVGVAESNGKERLGLNKGIRERGMVGKWRGWEV